MQWKDWRSFWVPIVIYVSYDISISQTWPTIIPNNSRISRPLPAWKKTGKRGGGGGQYLRDLHKKKSARKRKKQKKWMNDGLINIYNTIRVGCGGRSSNVCLTESVGGVMANGGIQWVLQSFWSEGSLKKEKERERVPCILIILAMQIFVLKFCLRPTQWHSHLFLQREGYKWWTVSMFQLIHSLTYKKIPCLQIQILIERCGMQCNANVNVNANADANANANEMQSLSRSG